MSDKLRAISRLERQAGRAAFRLRLDAVLARAAFLSVVPITAAAVLLTLVKVGWLAPGSRWLVASGAGAALVFVGGVLHAALRRRPPFEGALALDRHHGLRERVTNALAFSKVPEAERPPLMQAAMEDALAVSKDLSPRRAVPLHLPRDLGAAAALLAATAVLAHLEVPVRRVLPPPPKHVDALTLSPDDVELFRRVSEEAAATAKDPDSVAAARRFNQLVEDISDRRLDRREVFKRLDDLDRSLDDPPGHDAAALDEALDGVARELSKSALSKPVADALAEKRLEDAEQALRDLAKKVESAKKNVDRAKLEALRHALEKSAEVVKHGSEAGQAERREAEEQRKRLLKKKEKEGLTANEQQELSRLERVLKRLDRDKQRSEAQQEQLSGLDKDLAKAAEDLMKDLGQGAQDLEQGAQDLNRASQKRMSQSEKEELKRRIEELRQILRQEGQAGKERVKRMLSFGNRARGGQQGQGKQGKGGSGQGEGEQSGKGGSEKRLTLGQGTSGGGSAVVMMPGGGTQQGGGKEGESQGGGQQGAGEQWGTGHDPNVSGDATKLRGQTEDVTAAGVDTGQGSSTSEVIYGAAERGFVGRRYQRVFTDYQNVAEEALHHDEIPPGYRFYVRRYFQLIRPRD